MIGKLLCFLLCICFALPCRAAGITQYPPLNEAAFWQKAYPNGAAAEDLYVRSGQDLAKQPDYLSRQELARTLQVNLPLLEQALKVKGRPLSPEYKQLLTAQLNIAALSERNSVEMGVVVTRANLRALPTNDSLALPDGADRLQIAAIDPSEAVLILWQSKNKAFYLVRSRHHTGWLPVWTVAKTQRDIWLSYAQPDDFLLVTASQLALMAGREEKIYQMGARIPLQEVAGDICTIFLPSRDEEGYLVETTMPLGPSEHYRRGFLPASRHNILKEAFRLLGAPYGRDSMPGCVDGAVFIANVYRTVGVDLPRDIAGLEKSPGTEFILSGLANEAKTAMLDALKPGDLLFLPGRVLLYIGKTQGVYYVIHALDNHYANGIPANVKRVVVSDLTLIDSSSKKPYYETLTSALSYR